jgi:hypothetical protein
MKRTRTVFVILLLSFFSMSLFGKPSSRPHFGLAGGIGLPKIPISHFRTPISFLAGGMIHIPVFAKFGLQVDGYGLTTVSLGTVNNSDAKLTFDLVWGSTALTYQMRGFMESRAAIMAGLGMYRLYQRFDTRKDVLNTLGFNLGLSQWMRPGRRGGFFEIRWHLLFEPSDNPQVLTLTYGILL